MFTVDDVNWESRGKRWMQKCPFVWRRDAMWLHLWMSLCDRWADVLPSCVLSCCTVDPIQLHNSRRVDQFNYSLHYYCWIVEISVFLWMWMWVKRHIKWVFEFRDRGKKSWSSDSIRRRSRADEVCSTTRKSFNKLLRCSALTGAGIKKFWVRGQSWGLILQRALFP